MRNTSQAISWNCMYATQKHNPQLQRAPIVRYFPRKDTFPWFLFWWLLMQFQPHFIVRSKHCIFYFSVVSNLRKCHKVNWIYCHNSSSWSTPPPPPKKKVRVNISSLEQGQSPLAFGTKRSWSSCDWCWSIRRKRLTPSSSSCWGKRTNTYTLV